MAVEYEDRIPCSACGFKCNPKATPRGGEYRFSAQTVTVGLGTAVIDDSNCGCPSCGSPEWFGNASLGDMAGWHCKK